MQGVSSKRLHQRAVNIPQPKAADARALHSGLQQLSYAGFSMTEAFNGHRVRDSLGRQRDAEVLGILSVRQSVSREQERNLGRFGLRECPALVCIPR